MFPYTYLVHIYAQSRRDPRSCRLPREAGMSRTLKLKSIVHETERRRGTKTAPSPFLRYLSIIRTESPESGQTGNNRTRARHLRAPL
ncbi:hypothetical protein EVAR_42516_1 [Eumeta japonica]|uniref:Uncharacterized protein n=1 Tax=Eumeta variegata TaxID=151549 RepID=A0A4C1XFK1_EUMVA|nr:hypothetical protein EVAR_42516_1 [Eumeta japonica]